MWPSGSAVAKVQLKRGGFEMFIFLLLTMFIAVGFAVWIGILRLWQFYEQRTPPHIKLRVHSTAKNLPSYTFNLVACLLLWLGLGAMFVRFVLDLIGLEDCLPSTSGASGLVMFFVISWLVAFWEGSSPSDPIEPRGRRLLDDEKKGYTPQASSPEKGAARGRTIRSYRNVK